MNFDFYIKQIDFKGSNLWIISIEIHQKFNFKKSIDTISRELDSFYENKAIQK